MTLVISGRKADWWENVDFTLIRQVEISFGGL